MDLTQRALKCLCLLAEAERDSQKRGALVNEIMTLMYRRREKALKDAAKARHGRSTSARESGDGIKRRTSQDAIRASRE